MKGIQSYPLTWPAGWKRTAEADRKTAIFTKETSRPSLTPGEPPRSGKTQLSMADAIDRLLRELRLMQIEEAKVIISTNVPLSTRGYPRGDREPVDPGAAVYWLEGTKQLVMAIDRYDRLADNVAAVAATLDAMRRIERHGGGTIMERAFSGFAALPAPGQVTAPWRSVLCVTPGEQRHEVVKQSYRVLRSRYHPDTQLTGNADLFRAVQAAYKQACVELGMPT